MPIRICGWSISFGIATTPFTTDPSFESAPAWSPDGKEIWYTVGTGQGEILRKATSGATAAAMVLSSDLIARHKPRDHDALDVGIARGRYPVVHRRGVHAARGTICGCCGRVRVKSPSRCFNRISTRATGICRRMADGWRTSPMNRGHPKCSFVSITLGDWRARARSKSSWSRVAEGSRHDGVPTAASCSTRRLPARSCPRPSCQEAIGAPVEVTRRPGSTVGLGSLGRWPAIPCRAPDEAGRAPAVHRRSSTGSRRCPDRLPGRSDAGRVCDEG